MGFMLAETLERIVPWASSVPPLSEMRGIGAFSGFSSPEDGCTEKGVEVDFCSKTEIARETP